MQFQAGTFGRTKFGFSELGICGAPLGGNFADLDHCDGSRQRK
jgi:hypothetical protein